MFDKLTPAIIRAIIVFTVLLIASVAVVSASYAYMNSVSDEQKSAKRTMRIWQSKIDNSVQNNQIINEFEVNFLSLVNQGVVGSEDRLSWYETIQNTAKKRGMPSVKYRVSSQEPFVKENLRKDYRGIDVFKSVMSIDVEMAHEGDLFALLNDLAKADGLYAIDRCNIEKISKSDIETDNNMKAYCELGWYTFRRAQANTNRTKRK